MKLFAFLTIISIGACSIQSNNSESLNTIQHPSANESINVDSSQNYLQDIIDLEVQKSFKTRNIDFINRVLNSVNANKNIPESYKFYWKSYILYYKSIFHNNIEKKESRASKAISEAIKELEKELTTSDHHALHAVCVSYSMKFANMLNLSSLSSKVENSGNTAIKLDPKNVRAYYALASHNYYTPKMFGGMTRVEELSYAGLKCPQSEDTKYYTPTWGRKKIYKLLVKFYKKDGSEDKLIEIQSEAKIEFPNSF